MKEDDIAAPALATSEKTLPDISGARILVLGINYHPESTGIAPYTTGMAEYLAGCGADVEVITGFPHYPSWRREQGQRRRLAAKEKINGVDVLRLLHTLPRPMTSRRRAVYEASFFGHALLRTAGRRPDLVLAVSPALAGIAVGALISRRSGSRQIAVVQDLVAKASDQSGIGAGQGAASIAAFLERVSLRTADHVLIASEGFRQGVEEYGVDKNSISTLRNWTHIRPATVPREEARNLLGWSKSKYFVVHTGNMGFKQDLDNLVEASKLLPNAAGIEILLVGDGSQRASLERRAVGARNISFVAPVEETIYPLVLAAADVLVVNERSSVTEMSLPSKLTSYFVAGRPIIGAVSAGGATWRELAFSKAALLVRAGSPADLVSAVLRLQTDALLTSRLSSAGINFARDNLALTAATHELHVRVAAQLARLGAV